MPSDFPRSPKFLKGALVAYASQFLGPLPNVIVFQYNPAQLSRSLAHRAAAPEPSNVGAAREDVQQAQGPSVELNAVARLGEPHSDGRLASGLAQNITQTLQSMKGE